MSCKLTIIKKNGQLGGVCPMDTKELIIGRHTEAASAMARRALAEEAATRNAHRVTAVLVFKRPGVNLNLAMRSVAKRSPLLHPPP